MSERPQRPKRRATGVISGGECPICGRKFKELAGLEIHASSCSLEPSSDVLPRAHSKNKVDDTRTSIKSTDHQKTKQTKLRSSVLSNTFIDKSLRQATRLYRYAYSLKRRIGDTGITMEVTESKHTINNKSPTIVLHPRARTRRQILSLGH